MARRGGGGGGGSTGSMTAPVIGLAIGLLIFVILEIFAPTIAGTIEEAQPTLDPDSDWNGTHNTDLPNGAQDWTTNIRILAVLFPIMGVSIGIFYMKSMG